MPRKTTPYHNISSAVFHGWLKIFIQQPFVTSSPYSQSSFFVEQLEFWFIRPDNAFPELQGLIYMVLCKLQSLFFVDLADERSFRSKAMEIGRSSSSFSVRMVTDGFFLISRMILTSARWSVLRFNPLPGRSATFSSFTATHFIFFGYFALRFVSTAVPYDEITDFQWNFLSTHIKNF